MAFGVSSKRRIQNSESAESADKATEVEQLPDEYTGAVSFEVTQSC